MIKMLGGLLIVLAATGLGLRQSLRYEERPRELHRWIAALHMLQTEIQYAATPLPDAFGRIGERLSGEMRQVFLLLSQRLQESDGRSAAEVFRAVLNEQTRRFYLRPEDMEILFQFGETLGISDREDQLKHLALACSSLATAEKEAREESNRLGRMWRYMGTLLGLAAVILLY